MLCTHTTISQIDESLSKETRRFQFHRFLLLGFMQGKSAKVTFVFCWQIYNSHFVWSIAQCSSLSPWQLVSPGGNTVNYCCGQVETSAGLLYNHNLSKLEIEETLRGGHPRQIPLYLMRLPDLYHGVIFIARFDCWVSRHAGASSHYVRRAFWGLFVYPGLWEHFMGLGTCQFWLKHRVLISIVNLIAACSELEFQNSN